MDQKFKSYLPGVIRFILQRDKIKIDCRISRLHYKVTLLFMLGCASLVFLRVHMWEDFTCQPVDAPQPYRTPNRYCFLKDVLDNITATTIQLHILEEDLTIAIYEMVGYVLAIQAAIFYGPRYLWMFLEAGKLKALVTGLDDPKIEEVDKRTKINLVVDYVFTNLHGHSSYFQNFIACEVLNLCNAFAQIIFTNNYFGDQYTMYGPNEIQFIDMDQETPQNSAILVNQHTMLCHYVHSANDTEEEAREMIDCDYTLNIVNGNLYNIIRIWLAIITVLSALNLIYWSVLVASARVRCMVLKRYTRFSKDAIVMQVTEIGQFGDWFMLLQIAKNMHVDIFQDFIIEMAHKLQEHKDEENEVIELVLAKQDEDNSVKQDEDNSKVIEDTKV